MNIQVAIIEDEKHIRESMAILINGTEGFVCEHVYHTAEEALHFLPIIKPDVVLVDINLPGLSGIDCVRTLKPLCKQTQFMICTSYEDSISIFDALKAGASGYLTKTTSPTKLLESIQDIHLGGSPMSSQIARKVAEAFYAKRSNEHFEILSRREQEILEQLSNGFRYKEIADKFFISIETVRTHIRNIYEKLQVNCRTEALRKTGLL